MAFKFSPGDEVVLVSPKGSGWTSCRSLKKGARGVVEAVRYDIDASVVVRCVFPNIVEGWWVYESELDFADVPPTVEISALL